MHITEFEKLNYNYIIQELALKNEIGTLSRKSTLNELNTEEYNINKKIDLQPLIKDDPSINKELQQPCEGEYNDQDLDKTVSKSFQDIQEVNNNNSLFVDYKIDGSSKNRNGNEKPEININEKNSNPLMNSSNKGKKSKIAETNAVNINESDEELYEIDDDSDDEDIDDNRNNNDTFDQEDNNIFRRGQQKFMSSPYYRTKNMNKLYHLLNSVTPLYKSNGASKINPESQESWDKSEMDEEMENDYFSNTVIDNKQKKFKMLRFSDENFNEKMLTNNMNDISHNAKPYIENYVEISCKLLNSRIRLGKPIPVELEIINKGSNSIPYLKIVINAMANNKKDDSFCDDKILFAYYLEPGKKCIKKFTLEPYLWNNEEDSFYDDIKNINLNTNNNLGSNLLYSTNNISSTKSNIITNKNFSSYYYYSKYYTRNRFAKSQDKVFLKNTLDKSLNSITNIFDLCFIADKDGYDEFKENNEINYNAMRVIPKEAKSMLFNLPSSIKINIYGENGELLSCNNSEFTLKSEYFTQDFYLLGQYFKLNEDEACKNKSTKYKKYRKNKNYSLNILLVNSSVETKNKFIHSLEYALFVEKHLLSKSSVREFRDLMIETNNKYNYYNDNNSKFYWNNNKENYQEIKMANHFPKNIKFYDCPCNDKFNNKLKESSSEKCINTKRNGTFSKMNTLFKNKFNALSTISSCDSESSINLSNNKGDGSNSVLNDQYCCWLDGDEAELISKGELPLGKKILGEKIYYSDVEDDFYNDSTKKNPIHNIIYLFSQNQIENMSKYDRENINQNINKLLKMKKTLNICIFMDDCKIINTEYDNIKEYMQLIKQKYSIQFNIDQDMIFIVPYCIDRKIEYENVCDLNTKLNLMNNSDKVKKSNQEYLNFLNIEFLYLLMQKAEEDYSKICLK